MRALLLSLVLAGCAGAAPAPGEPAGFDEEGDVPMAGNSRAAAPAAAAPAAAGPVDGSDVEPAAAPQIPTEAAGVIPRTALVEVLDRGPGQFLVGIEIEATFDGNRFAGWQIVRFEPADARLSAAPLAPGDVVTAVNARRIVRPRHLQAAWDELRGANVLVIEGLRDGQAFALRYDIAP